MEANNLEMILTYITAFLGSGTGLAILGIIAKSLAKVVASVKIAKASKLSEKDKEEIADLILNKQSNKLTLNADAMVDRATNSRISAIEKSQAEIGGAFNNVMTQLNALLSAVGDFKTISVDSREKIQNILKGEVVAVEEIKVAEESTIEIKKEEVKEVKVSY